MAECEGAEEEEENREQQATELETLLSIFHEEITIVKDGAEFIVSDQPVISCFSVPHSSLGLYWDLNIAMQYKTLYSLHH